MILGATSLQTNQHVLLTNSQFQLGQASEKFIRRRKPVSLEMIKTERLEDAPVNKTILTWKKVGI